MFKKPNTESKPAKLDDRSIRDEARKPYVDFVDDLAVIYPEIVGEEGMSCFFGHLRGFRVDDVKLAANEIRASAKRKDAKKLIREFREGATPSDAGSES